MAAELVDLGASGLDERTNAVWAQCKGAPVSDEDAPDYGKAPMMCSLGVSARPAPATQAGRAQGVVVPVDGTDGVVVAGHDPRAADTFGEISPGETALHATGEGFDARVLCKDQLVSIVVGDDYVINIDRAEKQIAINCPGGTFKIGEKDGIVLRDNTGKAGIQLVDGVVIIESATILFGGRNPVAAIPSVPLLVGLPTTGPGIPVLPAPGLFVGA